MSFLVPFLESNSYLVYCPDFGVHYSFKIENPNSGIAFESSQYQVAFFDENGTVIETDSGYLELILPGQVMGIGGDVYLDEGMTTTYFEVQINAGDASYTDLTTTFSVDSIMYREGDYSSNVYGVISNPFESDITTLRVSSIVYNEASEIIGGGYTYKNFLLANDSSGVKVSTTNSGNVAKGELYPVLSGLSDIDASDDLPSDATDLVIVQYGYGQSGSQVGFGMILANPNENYSVEGTKYQVTVYAEDGSVIGIDEGYINLILPSQTLGFASELYVGDDVQSSTVDIKILSGDFEESEPIPPFSSENISYLPDGYYPKITGQIASPYTSDITQVKVSGICYDENGEIIGGGFTYLDFVPANSKAAAEVSVTCSSAPASSELFAALSGLSDIED